MQARANRRPTIPARSAAKRRHRFGYISKLMRGTPREAGTRQKHQNKPTISHRKVRAKRRPPGFGNINNFILFSEFEALTNKFAFFI